MKEQEQTNFNRIADAIGYLQNNFKQQPALEEVAEAIHISPFHFQKLFTEWAGVSPKKKVSANKKGKGSLRPILHLLVKAKSKHEAALSMPQLRSNRPHQRWHKPYIQSQIIM